MAPPWSWCSSFADTEDVTIHATVGGAPSHSVEIKIISTILIAASWSAAKTAAICD